VVPKGRTSEHILYHLFVEGELMRKQTDNSLIEMALIGYTVKRDDIVQRMADIRRQLEGRASAPAAKLTANAKRKHKISAAGRARIAEAQRRRWAASKKSAQSPTSPTLKPRETGRKAIVAATQRAVGA
jgi:hypothetical protein